MIFCRVSWSLNNRALEAMRHCSTHEYSMESRVNPEGVQCENTEGGFQNRRMPFKSYSRVPSKGPVVEFLLSRLCWPWGRRPSGGARGEEAPEAWRSGVRAVSELRAPRSLGEDECCCPTVGRGETGGSSRVHRGGVRELPVGREGKVSKTSSGGWGAIPVAVAGSFRSLALPRVCRALLCRVCSADTCGE